MNIRKITEKDIEEVCILHIDAWRKAYKGIIDENYLFNMSKEEKIKKRKQDYKFGEFIVAEIKNEIVGFCRYSYDNKYSSDFNNADAEILAIYVKADLKRRGIGKELFKYVINDLKNNGNKKMILWCLKDNEPSRKFYEKIGGKLLLTEKYIEIGEKSYKEVGYIYDVNEIYNKLNEKGE